MFSQSVSHSKCDRLNNQFVVYIDYFAKQAPRQLTTLEDDDGGRREEIASIGGSSMFSTFYDRLKEMREYYRNHQADDIIEVRWELSLHQCRGWTDWWRW